MLCCPAGRTLFSPSAKSCRIPALSGKPHSRRAASFRRANRRSRLLGSSMAIRLSGVSTMHRLLVSYALSARCSLFSVKVPCEILKASVDCDRCDGTAWPQFLGQLQRGGDVQAGGGPGEYSFLLREASRHLARVSFFHSARFIVLALFQVRRRKACGDPLDAVRTSFPRSEHRRGCRLKRYDTRLASSFLKR